ncbi:hypothetical protein Cni_G25515 [Canna indica]|uniref:Pentatricopeptide repeat-containing protein n=1 Tax=Canna indica TaxID=4628 RepID=A0AAQ3L4G6_9LILI|nr:hypothetical protein Cni_G25515 [Canna indica]
MIGIELDDHLSTTLIDLYSKCGGIDRAFELLGELRKRNLVSSSAMILGCGINGRVNDAVRLFQEMLDEKIFHNGVTFVGLLTTYNHVGLVEEDRKCFASMSKKNKIVPTTYHYAIIVDLLGHNGRLEEAYRPVDQEDANAATCWSLGSLASGL